MARPAGAGKGPVNHKSLNLVNHRPRGPRPNAGCRTPPGDLPGGARPLARCIVQRRPPLTRRRPSYPDLLLAMLVLALATHWPAGDAVAQSGIDSPFRPALTDPTRAQRFSPAASSSRLSISAVAAPSSAGQTGSDTTGATGKKRKAVKRKPGEPRRPPRCPSAWRQQSMPRRSPRISAVPSSPAHGFEGGPNVPPDRLTSSWRSECGQSVARKSMEAIGFACDVDARRGRRGLTPPPRP